jgi:uncharacterized membrane protein
VPGSPVPFTGNVVTVPKSAAHDLNVTIDEALQFFVSCGVVVPMRELHGKESGKNVAQISPHSAAAAASATAASATTASATAPAKTES